MSQATDLQSTSGLQTDPASGTVLGNTPQNTTDQPQAAIVLLNTQKDALVVTGEKQATVNHFPVTDVAVILVILLVSVIGVFAWFKD